MRSIAAPTWRTLNRVFRALIWAVGSASDKIEPHGEVCPICGPECRCL